MGRFRLIFIFILVCCSALAGESGYSLYIHKDGETRGHKLYDYLSDVRIATEPWLLVKIGGQTRYGRLISPDDATASEPLRVRRTGTFVTGTFALAASSPYSKEFTPEVYFTYVVSLNQARITGYNSLYGPEDVSIPPYLGGFPVVRVDGLGSVKTLSFPHKTLVDNQVISVGNTDPIGITIKSGGSIDLTRSSLSVGPYVKGVSGHLDLGDDITINPYTFSYSSVSSLFATGSVVLHDSSFAYSQVASVTFLGGGRIQGYTATPYRERAFQGCAFLTHAHLDGNFTDLRGLDSAPLTSLVFGENIEHIPYASFRYCTQLTEVVIPANILTIGSSAFVDATSLASVTFEAGTTILLDVNAFIGDLKTKYESGGAGTYTRSGIT